MTISQHVYIGYAVIVNLKFWDNLPAGVRGQLEQAMSEATDYANEIAQQDNDAALAGIKASGKTEIYYLSAEEKAAWRTALLPVHEKMGSRIGEDLVAAIHREAAAAGY
jgi:C4-dicarboxylate-binding protein DctP